MGVTQIWLGGTSGTYTSVTSRTEYLALGSGNTLVGGSTAAADTATRVPHRGAAVTLKSFRYRQPTNTRNGTSTVTVRKGGVSQTMAVSIASSTTGDFTDADTVSLSAGDTYNLETTIGGTSGTWSYQTALAYIADAGASAASQLVACNQTMQTSLASTSHGIRFGGGGNTATNGAERDNYIPVSGTVSNFFMGSFSNGRSTATTVTFYVGSAATALEVSIGAAATGFFEDTADSVAVTAGDLVGARFVTGTGTGTIYMTGSGLTFLPSRSGRYWVPNGFLSSSRTAGSTYYYSLGGETPAVTSSTFYTVATYKGVLRNLYCRVTTNSAASAVAVDVYKNSSVTSLGVSIGAAITGLFTDTADEVSFEATDTLQYVSSGGTSGSYGFYLDMESAVDPDGAGNMFLVF